MKSGLTIVEMAQQIERQSKLKQDYLLDTRRLQVEPFGSQLYLHTFDDHDDPLVEPLEINQIAHRQIGTHLKIPAAYYDRMLSDYPELLAENVNSWFQREPTQRMVRTLDGTVRAFLSNRYRRIDNLDIAEIVLPVIQQMEDAYFESCQITDSRMYIKVVNKRLEAEVVPGDIVQSGWYAVTAWLSTMPRLAVLTSAGSMRQMKTSNCSHRRHWPLMTTHLP